VAINGFGVIGMRVADAVALQDDMTLVGVADVVSDYRVKVAAERGYSIFAATTDARAQMEASGIPLAGALEDLLGQIDVVVDCTPKGVAAQNRERYRTSGVKVVWQGGEKHALAGYSFVAQVNYAGAVGRDSARVVSCNTTALSRVLHALHRHGWVKRARAVLLRRGTDPWESHTNGMINTVIPETKVPSHQGPDAQTVIPDLDITTLAGAGLTMVRAQSEQARESGAEGLSTPAGEFPHMPSGKLPVRARPAPDAGGPSRARSFTRGISKRQTASAGGDDATHSRNRR